MRRGSRNALTPPSLLLRCCAVHMRTPAYARAIVDSGLAKLDTVGQVTERGDVGSRGPTARDSTTGASPRSENGFLKLRAGRTTAMYRSAVTMFVASTADTTEMTNAPTDFAALIIGVISRSKTPDFSTTPPKASAAG